MSNIACQLWFHELQLSLKMKVSLLEAGLEIDDFFNCNIGEYIRLGINIIKAEEIHYRKNLQLYESTEAYLEVNHIKYIGYNSSEYPSVLRTISNPPIGLFVKGEIPDSSMCLAMVGARGASDYGKTAAFKLASQLSTNGLNIVSGMARGIDSCSHKGALQGGSATVAVMGSGFKQIYPRENEGLFREICEKGCVLTEFMPDVQPFPGNFPMRNRLISGLSKYVFVLEAGEQSGSLTTATLALEQGKDVFALPGNIFNPKSVGTNRLIQDGAKMITKAEDILEEFKNVLSPLDDKTNPKINSNCEALKEYTKSDKADSSMLAVKTNFNTVENHILDALKAGAVTVDSIIAATPVNIERLLAALSKLECAGEIQRLNGKYYVSKAE